MTPRQYATFTAIARFIEHNGFSPSQKKLAELVGTSPQNVHGFINGLVSRGFIRRDKHVANGLYLTDEGKVKWQEIKK